MTTKEVITMLNKEKDVCVEGLQRRITEKENEDKENEDKDKILNRLERINLDMNVIVCDCGKPYKNTDPHIELKEVIKSLKEK